MHGIVVVGNTNTANIVNTNTGNNPSSADVSTKQQEFRVPYRVNTVVNTPQQLTVIRYRADEENPRMNVAINSNKPRVSSKTLK